MVKLPHILLALFLLCLGVTAQAQPYVLKLATLAPPGTTWMNKVDAWRDDIQQRSGGRLQIRMYPNGVAGDEPDVLRKIRFGQLQGGLFSGYGIGKVYPEARILEFPFLYHDTSEVDAVRNHFQDRFDKGFRDSGFELLGWMEIGPVIFMSAKPFHSLEDLRNRKIWLWQGDPLAETFMDASNISPVPLSIIDVYTSLSTGLIDTVYSTPLAAIALQWFTRTPYVSDVEMTNAMGALLVSKRFFDRLPPDLQSLLRETGAELGKELISASREENRHSREALVERGFEFTMGWDDLDKAEMRRIQADATEALIASEYFPPGLVDETGQLLESLRTQPVANEPATAP